MQFSHILPADFLQGLSVSQRVRQYCNVVVFWTWLAQILEANASLSKAVSLVQAWCEDLNLPLPNEDTGAYSRGRGRLPMEFILAAGKRVNEHLNARIQPEDTYLGHVIKSLDGSSLVLDDTPENQEQYPQPSGQKPGCGFPVMGIMGVLNHAHGGWEHFAEGKLTAHDAPIYRKLLHCLNSGDIVCGDRAFCSYELMVSLKEKQVDTLMRLHQARHRKLDWRKGKRLGRHQRLVIWQKPAQQPSGSTLAAEEWALLPKEMEVRLIRFYFEDRDGKKRRMVLATTLTDHVKYDWIDLAAIYAQRWDIELRLRDVKTTLKMEHLRVKTPETARKTLSMALIAYNLIKSGCQEAGHATGKDLRLISFKGALDTIVANTIRYARRQKHPKKIVEIWESTIRIIAEKLIVLRPFRKEPRAQKKRPKSYGYLTSPRAIYREIPHRGNYRTCA